MNGEKLLAQQTMKMLMRGLFARILLQTYKKMLFTAQILIKMLKKRLDFSSQIVNL